jgi:tetratricopeptide (TPR) repeat protein
LRRGPLLAAAVALLVYLPSVAGGFLYDDQHVVVDNRAIRDLGALGTVLRSDPARPLLSLSWALNYALAGLRPWPYHLVNVAIHACNAALLASLFLWMAAHRGGTRAPQAALLGACLFAASPMAVETVAYVSSRSTALAALFVLASLRLAAPALEGGPRGRLATALLLFAAALATKEEAVSMPLFLLLLDLFFVAQEPREVLRRKWLHASFLALPLLGLIARRAVTGGWLPAPAIDPGRYLLTQWAAFPLYFLRSLLPIDPAFYRGHPPAAWPPGAATLIGSVATLALASGAVAFRRRLADWSFAVAWLAAGLLPSSSFVALKEMVVDHRAYLGGAGVAFALGGLYRPGRAGLAAFLVGLLAARSLHYEWVLADPVRAWEDAVRRAPRSVEARRALAEAHAARGGPGAEAALKAALELDPADARSWTNLGALYAEMGRMQEAAQAMGQAARLLPFDPRVRDNHGMLLMRLGREAEAETEFVAAVSADPPLAQPRINLAALLIRRGQTDLASRLLDDAARLEIDEQDARAIESLRARLK